MITSKKKEKLRMRIISNNNRIKKRVIMTIIKIKKRLMSRQLEAGMHDGRLLSDVRNQKIKIFSDSDVIVTRALCYLSSMHVAPL